ncbi:hypothetical protein Dsin_017451 [Dipteronia sinensis]|uniref:Reverse transcriptase domain-containing protein n=1 Tax=Dipteronia sinensis TaxID=43782 RepID=A0AAE0AF36_9ROSI|nr:hypothetical protein Dsin_017451 [Dipteronia sinensis]
MVESSQLLPISFPRGFVAVTHLLYADDVLIFCRDTMKNLRGIMYAFMIYSGISGQLVNWSKSLVGMKIWQFPFSYFGVFLFKGRPKWSVLQPIVDKIQSKFAKWNGRALSIAGSATLIKSVISSSFVH